MNNLLSGGSFSSSASTSTEANFDPNTNFFGPVASVVGSGGGGGAGGSGSAGEQIRRAAAVEDYSGRPAYPTIFRNNKVGIEEDIETGPSQGTESQAAVPQAETPTSPTSLATRTKENRHSSIASILRAAQHRMPIYPAGCKRWGSLKLSVKDDGTGMTHEQLKHVCTEGVQFNANELQAGQGRGLGLFITKGTLIVLSSLYFFFNSLHVSAVFLCYILFLRQAL